MINRRQFIKLGAAGSAGVLLPWSGGEQPVFALPAAGWLDPSTQLRFQNPLPNALAPSFIYGRRRNRKQQAQFHQIYMQQVQQNLGLVDPGTNAPLQTTVWGYGNRRGAITFPGGTFEAFRGQRVDVQWVNALRLRNHLLPVDSSVHWALGPTPALTNGEAFNFRRYGGIPAVPHLHGGHTESASDGLPEQWWTPRGVTGTTFVKTRYTYDNDQEAATLWYHDHALGITRLNVYAGLAGFYILRDENDTGRRNNPLGLPTYPYEIAAVIQDRMFDTNGQLFYPSDPSTIGPDFGFPPAVYDTWPNPTAAAEFFGDHILVNGVAWPKMDVEPREYRLRLLNGSDSRFYVLRLRTAPLGADTSTGTDDRPFYQIGTDDGFLPGPTPMTRLVIGPGERADLILDFATLDDQRVIIENVGPDEPFGGDVPPPDAVANGTTGKVMAFDVTVPLTSGRPVFDVNTALRPGPFTVPGSVAETRRLLLFEGRDEFLRLKPLLGTVDGDPATDPATSTPLAWAAPVTETPACDTTEIWEIYNTTADAHPIHLHLVAFEILNRQKFTFQLDVDVNGDPVGSPFDIQLTGPPMPPEVNEVGPKDTVHALPGENPDLGMGEVVRVKAKFDRPGRYVWHCHILSHEDHEMMRPFEVGPCPDCSGDDDKSKDNKSKDDKSKDNKSKDDKSKDDKSKDNKSKDNKSKDDKSDDDSGGRGRR